MVDVRCLPWEALFVTLSMWERPFFQRIMDDSHIRVHIYIYIFPRQIIFLKVRNILVPVCALIKIKDIFHIPS
jgi:hypothetical protein